ncbi:MAG: hypothetical protein VX498_11460, partial [Myxococcota bacterium]|nr:hypothetical protein [Myxococcota bacterium]
MNSPAGTIDGPLLRKTILGILGLLALAALCGWLFKDPIVALSDAFINHFGLWGIFLGVLITDTSPLPMTHEPIVLLGIGAGVPWTALLPVVAGASVLAGPLGWACGRFFVADSRFASWLERRHPRLTGFMKNHGIKAVAVAALLPIPFALATWTAGMMRLPL